MSVIDLHDALRGFLEVKGTGTADIKSNIFQYI